MDDGTVRRFDDDAHGIRNSVGDREEFDFGRAYGDGRILLHYMDV